MKNDLFFLSHGMHERENHVHFDHSKVRESRAIRARAFVVVLPKKGKARRR
jgi:hypothetical protein